MDFQKELEQLINKYSKENDSDTPDFILAEYMNRSLEMFNDIINKREMWYGRKSDIEIPREVLITSKLEEIRKDNERITKYDSSENQHQVHILPITPADFLDVELPKTLTGKELGDRF
jgi:hypothetical protein